MLIIITFPGLEAVGTELPGSYSKSKWTLQGQSELIFMKSAKMISQYAFTLLCLLLVLCYVS